MTKKAVYWDTAANIVWGCNNRDRGQSEACLHCYARRMHNKFARMPRASGLYKHPFETVQLREQAFADLSGGRASKVIFVANMGDLFHIDVSNYMIERALNVMVVNPQHTYIVLTKRAERMHRLVSKYVEKNGEHLFEHIWFGVTAENQQRWNERVPYLLEAPVVNRFISAEPLLGEITSPIIGRRPYGEPGMKIDMVIVGGESGPDARIMNPEWARSLDEICGIRGVKFYFKQYGDAYCRENRIKENQVFNGVDYSQLTPSEIWRK